VERMLSEGIIKKFTLEMDTGDKLKAIILISVQPSRPNPQVAQEVRNIEGVDLVLEVAGEVDIIVIVSGSSMQEVNRYIDEIRRIEGLSKTNSMIVLRTWV
ncbi:MAG: Lrp/AsnC family transcriptional regulator, partial [Candidatus Methanomethylicia archaeon]|nr:Lrp/AsnC family transcriptional regulator [Candidatus Methanomethylicia archaeon]